MNDERKDISQIVGDYKYGFKTEVENVYDTGHGINEDVVRKISQMKNEPDWMLDIRLKAYHEFAKMNWPKFGPNLDSINFDEYIYYIKSSKKVEKDWNEVPKAIKDILDSNIGTIGTNPIIQLKNKLAALPNGPWYIDCRNGLLYIHNKKFNEKPVHNYVYQSENGEVLSLSFETQRRTKSLGHSIGGGIDPFSKDIVGVNSNIKSPTPGPGTKEVKKTTGNRFKAVAAIDATRVVNSQAEMTRLKLETPHINKTLQKKNAAQRKVVESQYTAYKKGNTTSKQFNRNVAASKNTTKDK